MNKSTVRNEFNVLKIMLMVIMPPVSVYLAVGMKNEFWINVLLTLLGYVPGLIHGVFVVTRIL